MDETQPGRIGVNAKLPHAQADVNTGHQLCEKLALAVVFGAVGTTVRHVNPVSPIPRR